MHGKASDRKLEGKTIASSRRLLKQDVSVNASYNSLLISLVIRAFATGYYDKREFQPRLVCI